MHLEYKPISSIKELFQIILQLFLNTEHFNTYITIETMRAMVVHVSQRLICRKERKSKIKGSLLTD